MKRFSRQIIAASGLFVVLTTVATFAAMRSIELRTNTLELSAKDALLEASAISVQRQRERAAEIQANLDAKQAEIDQKKAELEATARELTEKAAALEAANAKVRAQEAQISANAKELQNLRNRPPLFTFRVDSSTLSDAEQKKEDIKALVTDAYDEIVAVYGKPYLLHSVTISFVNSFTNENAAAEIEISNGKSGLSITIRIKDFDKNDFNDVSAIVHEIIHSFHGVAILDTVADEEGITVAATDAVLRRLVEKGAIPAFAQLYIRISANDYNSAASVPRATSSFYSSSMAAKYYQTVGYGWYQLYAADSDFFKKFNEAMYEKKRNGEDMTETLVREVLQTVGPSHVGGVPLADWLQTRAFVLN